MAQKTFPGPTTKMLLELAETFYATTTMGSRICVSSREGPVVVDHDGFRFIDFHCDASVNNLGAGNNAVVSAMRNQIETGNIFSEHHNAPNMHAVELARELAFTSPILGPAKVYFGNSGAEANECAIKLCKAYRYRRGETRRKKMICFTNAFHGRTLGILPATNSKSEVQRDPFRDHCSIANTIYLPYPAVGTNWEKAYRHAIKLLDPKEIDRMIIELPCQGEGGIIPADEKGVAYLRGLAIAWGAIFIVDAIQCGMGRTNTLFGCEHMRLAEPDIITLGKALGGGLPIGATVFRANLDFAKPGMHSSTFGGGPLVARTALEVLTEIIALLDSGRIRRLEAEMRNELISLQAKFPATITDTRGIGAMWAHEIASPSTRNLIVERCEELVETEEYGLRLLPAGRSAIRFMPPLNISHDLLLAGFKLYEKVLSRT